MTFGEFIARLDSSCKVNIYDTYENRYNVYGGFICTIRQYSPILKLFSEREVIAFGASSKGGLNVALGAGDE